MPVERAGGVAAVSVPLRSYEIESKRGSIGKKPRNDSPLRVLAVSNGQDRRRILNLAVSRAGRGKETRAENKHISEPRRVKAWTLTSPVFFLILRRHGGRPPTSHCGLFLQSFMTLLSHFTLLAFSSHSTTAGFTAFFFFSFPLFTFTPLPFSALAPSFSVQQPPSSYAVGTFYIRFMALWFCGVLIFAFVRGFFLALWLHG